MTSSGARPGRADGAGRSSPALNRSSLLLFVGLLVFAAGSAVVILVR